MINLLSLSNELLASVISFCDNPSIVALSLTCRSLHSSLITLPKCNMVDLLTIERWPCYDRAATGEGKLAQPIEGTDVFACHLCLRIRSIAKFTKAMMKGKRGKRCEATNLEMSGPLGRFCIDCGIRSKKYIPGTTFQCGGSWTGNSIN